VEAVALRCQAVLEALRGRADAARRMIESSRRMVEELGIAQQLLEADVFAGLIDLLEGDAEAAEMSLRRAYEGLRERGLRIDAARAAALLGRALLAQGRAAEAESLSHESEVLGGDDLKAAIAWRGVRAQAQAEHGETAQAVELARAAVAIASATDALLDHADARLALATALRAAGRGPEADAEEARAIELWEAKGATLLTGRVRRADAAALAPPYPAPLAGDPARAARPRVRPNAATENEARVAASVAARDLDAFAALFAGDAVEVHHQAGVVLDAGEARRLYERMFAAEIEGLRVATEPLATLGERLALVRSHISLASGRAGEAVSVGATDMSSIALVEVGADGLRTRTEFFATDQLAAAIARIYERLAELEPEGPAREAAARRARVVAAIFVLAPLEPIEEHFAPAVELADHRVLGFGTVHGIEALRRSFPTLRGLADDVAVRVDDVLALDRDAFLLRSTTTGTEREGGGRFERPMLQLRCFGADGRMTRSEWFEPDRDAAALARFDELTRTEAPAVRRVRPNAATENMERLDAAMAARDVAAVEAVFAVEVEVIHHPLRAEFGRDGAIESLRTGLEDRALVFRHEPLATLGDALALSRLRVATNRIAIDDIDAGPVDFDHLVLVEVNGKGQRVRSEFFAPTELAAAITRLYERHAALVPDGPERERAAATARALDLGSMQPESVARRVAPEVELVDHRTAGLPPTRGAEALARVLAVAFEIADDAVDRLDDILAAEPHALLTRWTTAGRAREGGGAFEWAFLLLGLFGADGRTVRIEVFDGDRDEEAIARFEELAGGVPPPPSPNAAMRSEQATVEAWRARDWGAVEATYAPGFRSIDRRSLMRVETDREGMLTWLRPLFEMGVSRESTLLATRGDRLAIYRIRLSGSDGLSGPSEVELLQVIEVDQESGRRVAAVAFDAGDFDAAYAELDARYAAGEGAAFPRTADAMRAFAAALAHRDWEALAGCCAPDLVVDDHRRLGWEPLRGPAAYVAALRALVELAPDTQMRLDHVEMAERGFLVRTVWVGTRDGGAFEEPSWMVGAIDPAGRMRHLEQYDADRLDAARARFAELARSDPHGFGTNTAVAAHDRVIAAFAARDWEAMRACFAPGARIEDRRALLRTPPIDADTAVDAMRRGVEVASDLRTERRTFGVFGDCVSLERQTWRGGQGAAVFETEALTLVESDAAGRIAAIVTFGPADTLAAESEANDRWMAASRSPQAEPALAGLAELRAGREVRAPDPLRIPPNAAWRIWERIGAIVAARDWAALRSLAAADFEFDDRRRRALLRGEVELYIRNLAFVRSWPGRRVAPELVATAGERLALDRVAFVGDPDGGAFEGEFLRLTELDAEGRLRAVLHFDADDVAAAREELRARHARIEAPRADPLRIPPNAATRGVDRWLAAAGARDEAAMTALFSAAFRFDDRRPLVADSGDLEKMRASMRLALASGTRVSAETLATAGDQLALHRILFSSSDEEAPAEIEILQLVEVDAEGRIAATISFDPGDRRGAAVEMTERWARGESFFSASTLAALRALVEGDLEALRAALPQEFRFLDCRRTGLGALDRDAYVESLEALFEQSRDAMMEGLYTLATSACGSLSVARAFGTLAGGGTFESVYVRILHFRDEKLVGVELYELDDLERARARFDELRAGAEDVPR
jgi:ketosteroid isomerase-like protein